MFEVMQPQKTDNIHLKVRDANSALFSMHTDGENALPDTAQLQQQVITLQNLVNTSQEKIRQLVPKSFLLSLPRQQLSGDFCWAEKSGDKTYIGVGDCTGQSIRAAHNAIIACHLLTAALENLPGKHPAEILDEVNAEFYSLFNNENGCGEQSFIRMALIAFNPHHPELEYAAALNPIYLTRQNTLEKLPADRFPVGPRFGGSQRAFTPQHIQLNHGDTVYLFSDGYAAQTGGRHNKKFNATRFRQLLLSIQDHPMPGQKRLLDEELKAWMGPVDEQTDDITVLGLNLYQY